MINVYFLKDHKERKKGDEESIQYKRGDQAFIDRHRASELLVDGTVEAYTTHVDRVGIEPKPKIKKKDEVKKEKLKRKKSKREYAVSKQAEKREKAVAA